MSFARSLEELLHRTEQIFGVSHRNETKMSLVYFFITHDINNLSCSAIRLLAAHISSEWLNLYEAEEGVFAARKKSLFSGI
jgi:hypothetical protein